MLFETVTAYERVAHGRLDTVQGPEKACADESLPFVDTNKVIAAANAPVVPEAAIFSSKSIHTINEEMQRLK